MSLDGDAAAHSSVDPVDVELPRKVVVATMAGVMAAMLMAALDGTIVGTAMPRVVAELHGFEHYAAVTTVYMLASTVVVPVVGKLSDIFGRKPFLLTGVAIFVLGSVLCGMATSMTQLVVFRGVQGIGAGFSQAMAFTTIADLFPPARRGKVSGLMGAVFGLSSVIGPAVGGFLTDGPGWRWCFYVNVPVGIAAFAVLFFFFPRRPPDAHPVSRSIDWLGAVTLTAGVVPLLVAMSSGGRDYAWGSTEILGLVGVGVVMCAVFIVVELRADAPIFPLALFKNRTIWTTSVAATAVSAGMFGTMMFIPLFIQGVVGTSATKSGAVVTPMMFAMIASSIVSGQLMTRMGKYKWNAVVGCAVTTLALFLLSTMDVATSYSTVLTYMVIMGLGLGATMPVFNLAVQNAVEHKDVGVGTASVQFLRSLGGAVGGAAFGAVLTNRFAGAFYGALPDGVAATMPPAELAKYSNPQMLMNPEMQTQLESGGPEAMQRLAPILGAVKQALADSVTTVFLIGTIVVAVGLVFTFLLRDVPLRTTRGGAPPPPAGH